MKRKFILALFLLLGFIQDNKSYGQIACDYNNIGSIYSLNANDYPFLLSSGITASVTYNLFNPAYGMIYSHPCGTSAPVSTPPPSFWINGGTAEYITFTFDVPVTNFSLAATATNTGESFTVTAATGTVILSNNCPGSFTIAGNTMTCVAAGVVGTLITVDNPAGSYSYTLTHSNNNMGGNGTLIALLDCVSGCPSTRDTIYPVICQGQTYQVGTSNYSTSGTYTDVFKNVDDCDSTIITILTVNPTHVVYKDTAIYEGDSVTIAGIHHKFEGTYNYRWQTTLGCDSNFTLRLKVIPWRLDTLKPHICIGEKFYLDTVMYDRTGVYFDTFRYEWGHRFYRTELTVHPLPIITITPNPKNPDLICVHDSLDVTAKGAVYYEWYYITPKEELRFGDTTDKQTAYLFYDNTTIRVLGRDEWNCENTKEVSIKGEHCCRIFAPNAFSPNGDGLNDKFEVYSQSLPHEYRLEVFNRYGQSIFVSNNLRHQWDGTLHNGDFAPNDTYFYIISGKCSNFEPIFQKGDITLVR